MFNTNKINWKVWLSVSLIGLSVLLYGLHYLIFRDMHHIFLYLVGDIAFIPIDVLLVVLVLHGIITNHEKQMMLKKMNMVIGAFFSEVGIRLLKYFVSFDKNADSLRSNLLVRKDWTQKEFQQLKNKLQGYQPEIDLSKGDLNHLRDFLILERQFLLGLLENPNLLEHERFTSILWAVFHLSEELSARPQVSGLPASDYEHLASDIKRAYTIILMEWVSYMAHLQRDYPYLFSLAMRTNPFDRQASPVIKQ